MSQVFISYSRKDGAAVGNLVRALENVGIDAWIDREDIRAGNSWRQQIVEAIDSCSVFVLALSPNSAASENVRKEIDLAQDSKRLVVPFLLEATTLPAAIRYQLAGLQHIDVPMLGMETALVELIDILRQELAKKKTPPKTETKTAEVVIQGVNLADFDASKQAQLLAFLAGLTQTDPAQLKIADLRAGSVHAFVEMPARAAYQLKTMALNHDRRLSRERIFALRLRGDSRLIPTSTRNFLPPLIFAGLILLAALALWIFLPAPTREATPTPPQQTLTPSQTLPPSATFSAVPPSETFTPPPSLTPTEEALTAALPAVSRCDIFANAPITYTMLKWNEGKPLTFYFKISGGVPGVERNTEGEWFYFAEIDGHATGECKFAGYKERLYCAVQLPSSYSFTLQNLKLYVSECQPPVYENPRAEIPKIQPRPSGGANSPADAATCDAPSWCSCISDFPICPVP